MPEQKPIHITRQSTLRTTGAQTDGLTRQNAIVNIAPNICGTLMLAPPRSHSAVHHHGHQNTIVYAVRGRGSIVSEGGTKIETLEPGDWALIPAWAEHQEVNEGGEEEEVVWVIVRSGEVPVVENLGGWEGESLEEGST